ncbi:hypothetical protein J6590_096127, partial [Homalodisca vitripennis]
MPGNCSTHVAGNNLDVTLATPEISRKIKNWKVNQEESINDHRLITFELDFGTHINLTRKTSRFNVRKLNKEKFNDEFESKNIGLQEEVRPGYPLSQRAIRIQGTAKRAQNNKKTRKEQDSMIKA